MNLNDIARINSRCRNGWKFEKEYFVLNFHTGLYKTINIDNKSCWKFILSYNFQNQIILHINKYYINQEKGNYFSKGIGKTNILSKKKAIRKDINNLIEFTKVLTDDELMKFISNTYKDKFDYFSAVSN